MKNFLSVIENTSIFNGLSINNLQKILNITVDKFYTRGEIIFMEGDDSSGFYIIIEGKIKIYKLSTEGKEQILHIYGSGNPFGEVPVFSGDKFPANAQAISKSHLLFFPKNAFIKLISDNPFLSMNMLAVLSKRLRRFTLQIENLSLKEVPGRLASYIVYLIKKQEMADSSNNEKMVTLQISKGQLASLLGTIPETLSRILTKMNTQQLIEVYGKKIKILNYNGLKKLAEHGKL